MHRRDLQAESSFNKRLSRLRTFGRLGVEAINDDIGGRITGHAQQVTHPLQGLKPENLWANRDQNQIGASGCFDSSAIRAAGGINKNQVSAIVLSSLNCLLQPAYLG